MIRILMGLALAVLASPAVAQAGADADSPLVTALAQCQRIADAPARLACFDKAAGALVSAAQEGQVTVVNREQVSKARRSLFGFSVPDLPIFGGRNKEEAPKELKTTLVSGSESGYGRYRFTIAEGNAVWETTESASLGRLQAGQSVVIRRGALGGHFIKLGSEQWVRGRRVR